jgi:hypothetical protein
VGFTTGCTRTSPRKWNVVWRWLLTTARQRRKMISTPHPGPRRMTMFSPDHPHPACGHPPHEPRSSGRESAPSDSGEKLEPTHVGCYGSGSQCANLGSGNSLPLPRARDSVRGGEAEAIERSRCSLAAMNLRPSQFICG